MVPIELHRFAFRLMPAAAFRDWLYGDPSQAEALDPALYMALLEADYGDWDATVQLQHRLARTMPPLGLPDDVQAEMVRADQLQAEGDVRGDLIMLQATGETRGGRFLAESEIFEAHGDALLGDVAPAVARGDVELEWYMGFVVRMTFKRHVDLFETVAKHPTFVRLLEVRLAPDSIVSNDFAQSIADFSRHPSSVATLVVDAQEVWRHSELGHLDAIWKAHPKLRVVELNGFGESFGSPELNELLSLTYRSPQLLDREVRSIVSATWPALERLELWFGNTNATIDDLAYLFTGEPVPRLAHLALRSCHMADLVCEHLASSPIVRQLRTVDLTGGILTDEGGEQLLDARLDDVEHLILDRNYLTPTMTQRLHARYGTRVRYALQSVYEPDQSMVSDERFSS